MDTTTVTLTAKDTSVTLTAKEMEAIGEAAQHLRGRGVPSKKRLREIVTAIEALEREKANVGEAITDKYNVAKAEGFNVKALREVVKRRRMDADERASHDMHVALYEQGLLAL